MPAVLACNSIYRSFPLPDGRLQVLAGVDLVVLAGETIAILGPSGSGKSTLIHLLAGLDSPDHGEIWWGDFPVHEHKPQQLASRRSRLVGLVFQNHYLLEDLTVLENVTLPGRILGRWDRQRGLELLEAMGLEQRAGSSTHTLSGGERQRVAIARALYLEPPLVLADEPTGSLDRDNARAVFDLLVELVAKDGTAVVLVTHDESLVAAVDHRLRLERGKLIDDGFSLGHDRMVIGPDPKNA